MSSDGWWVAETVVWKAASLVSQKVVKLAKLLADEKVALKALKTACARVEKMVVSLVYL